MRKLLVRSEREKPQPTTGGNPGFYGVRMLTSDRLSSLMHATTGRETLTESRPQAALKHGMTSRKYT